jgi:transposase
MPNAASAAAASPTLAPIAPIGVESTGGYAAGLVRLLRAEDLEGARGHPV